MDANLSVLAIGATRGITYAVERMSRSNGGKGGRIITTASIAGLVVRSKIVTKQTIPQNQLVTHFRNFLRRTAD